MDCGLRSHTSVDDRAAGPSGEPIQPFCRLLQTGTPVARSLPSRRRREGDQGVGCLAAESLAVLAAAGQCADQGGGRVGARKSGRIAVGGGMSRPDCGLDGAAQCPQSGCLTAVEEAPITVVVVVGRQQTGNARTGRGMSGRGGRRPHVEHPLRQRISRRRCAGLGDLLPRRPRGRPRVDAVPGLGLLRIRRSRTPTGDAQPRRKPSSTTNSAPAWRCATALQRIEEFGTSAAPAFMGPRAYVDPRCRHSDPHPGAPAWRVVSQSVGIPAKSSRALPTQLI